MTISRSKYRRLPYLQRLQVSSQRARDNFYKPHPHSNPHPPTSPLVRKDSPLDKWDVISKGIERRIRNKKGRDRSRRIRARRRKALHRADVAARRLARQFEQRLQQAKEF